MKNLKIAWNIFYMVYVTLAGILMVFFAAKDMSHVINEELNTDAFCLKMLAYNVTFILMTSADSHFTFKLNENET